MSRWLILTMPLSLIMAIAVFFAIILRIPPEWGSLALKPSKTLTVYGTSKEQRTNEIASFSAGVNEYNVNKDIAINTVNETINTIISAVQEFGIPDEDIKTQNISVNRMDDPYWIQQGNEAQWSVNNSVEITLRDVSRADELADLLSRSGASSVYGPNFRLDDDQAKSEVDLLNSAISDAREKATKIAAQNGTVLGDILTIDETMSNSNSFEPWRSSGMGGGPDAMALPGTSTVTKSVVVVFELE